MEKIWKIVYQWIGFVGKNGQPENQRNIVNLYHQIDRAFRLKFFPSNSMNVVGSRDSIG